MCNPASFVIARNGKKAFWSRLTDSHEEIITEHKLVEMVADKICIARVEIVPPCGDMTKPLKQWIFRTDQNILPNWYDPKLAEKVCRGELKDWFASKVFLAGEHEIKEGLVYALGSSRVVARDSSSVVAWGSSRVVARDSSSVEAWDSSRVVARDSSTIIQIHSTPKITLSGWAVNIDRSGGKPVIRVTGE